MTTTFTLVLGLVMGSIAGYFGGRFDTVITAVTDLTWGFPLLLVAVVFAGMLGPGLRPVIFAVAVVIWAGFARMIRAEIDRSGSANSWRRRGRWASRIGGSSSAT